MKIVTFVLLTAIFLTGCVSKKKLIDSEIALRFARNDSAQLAARIADQKNSIAVLQKQVSSLNDQNNKLLADAANIQAQLKNQLSTTSIALQQQQKKANDLQALLDQQKQAAQELKKKMADALTGFTANDLTITQKNGKVYVSLSENLLFPSGSAAVNDQGKAALLKLSEVLNLNPDIAVTIEGHTDSIPIRKSYEDNWALSTARAASIVRILVNDYKVSPVRVIASGHSEYDPIDTNSTPEGRARNRRTEIILTPNLDALYKLIEQ